MNDEIFATAHRSLHGLLAGMLCSAWERRAEQALRGAGSRGQRVALLEPGCRSDERANDEGRMARTSRQGA